MSHVNRWPHQEASWYYWALHLDSQHQYSCPRPWISTSRDRTDCPAHLPPATPPCLSDLFPHPISTLVPELLPLWLLAWVSVCPSLPPTSTPSYVWLHKGALLHMWTCLQIPSPALLPHICAPELHLLSPGFTSSLVVKRLEATGGSNPLFSLLSRLTLQAFLKEAETLSNQHCTLPGFCFRILYSWEVMMLDEV